MRRRSLLASTVAAVVLLACRALPAWAQNVAQFEAAGVAVTISYRALDLAGHGTLAATFTPLTAGFHLYSKDLPKTGVQGLGRPTLLELVASATWHCDGPLTADARTTALEFPALHVKLPVYPAGPVTLSLPVTHTHNGSVAGEISITYMACSEHACRSPVVDKRIAVTVPSGR